MNSIYIMKSNLTVSVIQFLWKRFGLLYTDGSNKRYTKRCIVSKQSLLKCKYAMQQQRGRFKLRWSRLWLPVATRRYMSREADQLYTYRLLSGLTTSITWRTLTVSLTTSITAISGYKLVRGWTQHLLLDMSEGRDSFWIGSSTKEATRIREFRKFDARLSILFIQFTRETGHENDACSHVLSTSELQKLTSLDR